MPRRGPSRSRAVASTKACGAMPKTTWGVPPAAQTSSWVSRSGSTNVAHGRGVAERRDAADREAGDRPHPVGVDPAARRRRRAAAASLASSSRLAPLTRAMTGRTSVAVDQVEDQGLHDLGHVARRWPGRRPRPCGCRRGRSRARCASPRRAAASTTSSVLRCTGGVYRLRPTAGQTGPVHRWLVAGALIEGDDGLLLVRNRRRNGREDWSTPGRGHRRRARPCSEGLAREVAGGDRPRGDRVGGPGLRDPGRGPGPRLEPAGRGPPGRRPTRATWSSTIPTASWSTPASSTPTSAGPCSTAATAGWASRSAPGSAGERDHGRSYEYVVRGRDLARPRGGAHGVTGDRDAGAPVDPARGHGRVLRGRRGAPRPEPARAGRSSSAGPGDRGVVAAASYEARAYGVHSAMPTGRARRLCPHAVFLPGHHERYGEVSAPGHGHLPRRSPRWSSRCRSTRRSSTSPAPGASGAPARRSPRQIRAAVLDEEGLTCSVGVAPDEVPGQAGLGGGQARSPPSTASGPGAGVVVVPVGGELAFLHPLPVRALWGVGPEDPRAPRPPRRRHRRRPGRAAAGHPGGRGRRRQRPPPPRAGQRHRRPGGRPRPGASSRSATRRPSPRTIHDHDRLGREVVRLADAVGRRLRAARPGRAHRRPEGPLRRLHARSPARSPCPTPVDSGRVIARSAQDLLGVARRRRSGVRLLGVSVSGLVGRRRRAARPRTTRPTGRRPTGRSTGSGSASATTPSPPRSPCGDDGHPGQAPGRPAVGARRLTAWRESGPARVVARVPLCDHGPGAALRRRTADPARDRATPHRGGPRSRRRGRVDDRLHARPPQPEAGVRCCSSSASSP